MSLLIRMLPESRKARAALPGPLYQLKYRRCQDFALLKRLQVFSLFVYAQGMLFTFFSAIF